MPTEPQPPVVQRRPAPTGPRRRAARPLRVLAIAGVAGVAVLSTGTFVADSVASRVSSRSGAAPAQALSVPVLSVRRTPTALSEGVRIANLGESVGELLERLPPASCLEVRWLGRTVTTVRTADALTPASVIKLATAVAALRALGPDSVFSTEVKGTAVAGVVEGDLFLVGGGDPLLVREEYPATERYATLTPTYLESLADSVVAAGVREVRGGIVGDDSRYDDVRFPPTWPGDFYGTVGGPIGALVVSDGAFLGEVARPTEPAVTAARELRRLLVNRGVTVTGIANKGVAAAELPVIAKVDSAPVREVVREMLVNSDNNTAEMLVKEIGKKVSGIGSWDAGLAAVRETLADLGLTTEGFVQVDGSGLSSENKMSCRMVAELLSLEATTLAASLAVAGQTGTLDDDFLGQSVAGRLVAKTGTLTGVKGLAGFLPVVGSSPVQFVLLMSGPGVDTLGVHRPLWNSLARSLDTASAEPTPESLMP